MHGEVAEVSGVAHRSVPSDVNKPNHPEFGSCKTSIHESRLEELKGYPESRRSCWACTARSRKCRALRAAECTCGIASWKFCLCTYSVA